MALEQLSFHKRKMVSTQGWVLVLVREQHLRQLLLTVLSQVGYTLLGCATLAEARQVLGQHSLPSLLIFDGAEASEARLREHLHQIEGFLALGASCRIIVLSLSHPQPRPQQLPGVDALIARPFDLTAVLDKVEALMQLP